MPSRVDRREFIKTSSLAAGALAFGVPALLRGQNLNSKLNVACVGIGGKGRSDTDACAGENIVALCDVDAGSDAYETQTKKYPNAKFYKDFRQMLDQMDHQIDAVTVSTPDHMHAIVASAAMRRNKAVFVQKPLTQTVYEARYLRKMAHDRKLVTQMGNQGSAADGLRRGVETIQDGLIGQVHEVHVWTNRPIWPQAMDRPTGEDPVPATLDWDVWIGAAPMRPYVGRPSLLRQSTGIRCREPRQAAQQYQPSVPQAVCWSGHGLRAPRDQAARRRTTTASSDRAPPSAYGARSADAPAEHARCVSGTHSESSNLPETTPCSSFRTASLRSLSGLRGPEPGTACSPCGIPCRQALRNRSPATRAS